MKVGLVLEGGAMRGMFTAGVLDIMLENNIKIDGIIGVSAGALFGVNYFSNQKGRVIRYNKKYCNDKRYISLKSLITTGNIVNKDFAYYKVSNELDIFDEQTYVKTNKDYFVTVTNVETGKPEYIKITEPLKQMEELRATSAMPLASKIVKINGKKYLDGGISDSIPILKLCELGYDKIIVILTQPFEYRKKPIKGFIKKLLVNLKFNRYKNLLNTIYNRYKNYNETIERIIEMENNKEIFVIRPTESINIKIIERDENKLQEVYDLGVDVCKNNLESLKKFLNN